MTKFDRIEDLRKITDWTYMPIKQLDRLCKLYDLRVKFWNKKSIVLVKELNK